MPTPDVPFLRALMGDPWVDAEVFGGHPTHVLGLWMRNKPDNLWMPYIERLLKTLLTSTNVTLDRAVLRDKIKSDYVSTLAEVETAVFLLGRGFTIIVEPSVSVWGPDLRADFDGVSYFLEVRSVGDAEEEDRFNSISRQVFSTLNTVPSSYTVAITLGDEYEPLTPELKRAIDAILECLTALKEKKWKKATLYYSASGALLNPDGDFDRLNPGASRERQGRREVIVDNADFIARFAALDEEQDKTSATVIRWFNPIPEADKTHERLKRILNKKRTQLPEHERGIIVLEVSELFMLSDFSIESALYGDLTVGFPSPASAGEPLGEPVTGRKGNGFFGKTSRVSAVVIYTRVPEAETIQTVWKVYPTNRANADAIRLPLVELERLGELGERARLSAENAPIEPEASSTSPDHD